MGEREEGYGRRHYCPSVPLWGSVGRMGERGGGRAGSGANECSNRGRELNRGSVHGAWHLCASEWGMCGVGAGPVHGAGKSQSRGRAFGRMRPWV